MSMSIARSSRRRSLAAFVALALAAAAVMISLVLPASSARANAPTSQKPTIVLVHGAFADASSWRGVVDRLQRLGYPVLAPANPLEGVSSDSSYLRAILSGIRGPVVLVGHSYGGMVITDAATGLANVKALVYVAAYAPDQGDSVESLETLAPGGMIGPSTLNVFEVPSPSGTGTEPVATIQDALFHQIFAADLSDAVADQMAVSQRPAALALLGEPSGPPAWKTIPSWYVIPGQDHAIGTQVEQIMAHRIGAHITEVPDASHVVMISHANVVVRVIVDAARATT